MTDNDDDVVGHESQAEDRLSLTIYGTASRDLPSRAIGTPAALLEGSSPIEGDRLSVVRGLRAAQAERSDWNIAPLSAMSMHRCPSCAAATFGQRWIQQQGRLNWSAGLLYRMSLTTVSVCAEVFRRDGC